MQGGVGEGMEELTGARPHTSCTTLDNTDISLRLNFLLCKMDIIIVPSLETE